MLRKPIMASMLVLALTAALTSNSKGVVRASQRGQATRMMKNSWWSKRSSTLPNTSTSTNDFVANSPLDDQPIEDLNAQIFLNNYWKEVSGDLTGVDRDFHPDVLELLFSPCSSPYSANYQAQPPLSYYVALRKALQTVTRRKRDTLAKFLRD
ncbi:uncharacterized protein LOC135200604 [Macrobrachium nipponense]|uniref:uncharacterized protein LOC135200604 n=1 Tax=Macrobrachium nipponense TaxID=159736 RepID=UPI0030C7E7E5